jgi:hypothetical protein
LLHPHHFLYGFWLKTVKPIALKIMAREEVEEEPVIFALSSPIAL